MLGHVRVRHQLARLLLHRREHRLRVRVVDPEHRVVAADVELPRRLAQRPHVVDRHLRRHERRDAGVAVARPVLARQAPVTGFPPAIGANSVHSSPIDARMSSTPITGPIHHASVSTNASLRSGKRSNTPPRHQLPQRPAGEERVLHRPATMKAEKPERLVVGSTGAAVLAQRQPHLHAGGPDRVQCGIEEELGTRVQRRHHDAAEALLLHPVDVRHRLVHVVERHHRLARTGGPVPPSRSRPATGCTPSAPGSVDAPHRVRVVEASLRERRHRSGTAPRRPPPGSRGRRCAVPRPIALSSPRAPLTKPSGVPVDRPDPFVEARRGTLPST